MKTMTCRTIMLAFASGLLAIPSAADAQRQTMQRPVTQADEQTERRPCGEEERGHHCRVRAADVGVRQAGPEQLSGSDPGWGVTEEDGAAQLGGADPGWGARQAATEAPETDNFGGEDPGWADGRVRARPSMGASMPRPAAMGDAGVPAEHMECDLCDDDEDEPQGPINNPPRPSEPETPDEPAEDEDCIWRNPPEGPDQEFCDE